MCLVRVIFVVESISARLYANFNKMLHIFKSQHNDFNDFSRYCVTNETSQRKSMTRSVRLYDILKLHKNECYERKANVCALMTYL